MASKNEKQPEKTIEKLTYQNDERYLRFVKKTLKIEGGLSFNKKDKGGTTKYGVSFRFLVGNGIDINKDYKVDEKDIIDLTHEQALEIYYQYFYETGGCKNIVNDKLAANVFDMSINAGIGAANKLLQKVLNGNGAKIKEDGIIGSKTLEAINNIKDQEKLNHDYCNERINFYEAICIRDLSQKIFLNGWKNRVQQFV